HDRPQRADSDAYVTAEWFLTLLQKLETLPKETIFELYQLSKQLKSDLHYIFDKAYRDSVERDDQFTDLHKYKGIRYKKAVKTEHIDEQHEKFSLEQISDMLRKGFQDEFELREGQEEMVSDVYHSLHNGDISLIEAEIGFGKTISYILPAAVFSINEGKPVVISAHTISQQHHILNVEVPRVE